MPRPLVPFPIPAGEQVLRTLPALARMLAGDGPALLPVDESRSSTSVLALAGDLQPTEDDPADPTGLVIATSGSTGSPKGALLPSSALRASAAATASRLRRAPAPDQVPAGEHKDGAVAAPPGAHWLLALPADHIAGMQVLLRSIAVGTEPTVLPDGPFTAAGFTAAVATMPIGPRLVSLVPTQLHRILSDPDATAAAATFDAVLLGGAAADPGLLARAAALRVVTTYGMSETGGGCVYDGVPLDGVTVTIEDGRVVLAGDVVARGYRNRPGDPAFRTLDGRRRFHTSDLGRVDGGVLSVTGRADDVLVTGGVKISPAEVEAAMGRVDGVTAVLLTAVPDLEWGEALVALVVGDDVADESLRAAARTVHPAAVPRSLIRVAELPRRGIGKPDRTAARALARELTAVHPAGPV